MKQTRFERDCEHCGAVIDARNPTDAEHTADCPIRSLRPEVSSR